MPLCDRRGLEPRSRKSPLAQGQLVRPRCIPDSESLGQTLRMAVITMPDDWSAVPRRVRQTGGPLAWSYMVLRNDGGEWELAALSVRRDQLLSAVTLRYRDAIVAREQISPRAVASAQALPYAPSSSLPRLPVFAP